MAVELFIHKMSEHMETARIVHWLVKEGETIQQFQILMEVETDKAVAELESPASGVLKGIRPGAVDGAEVKVGEVIAFIAAPEEVVPTLPPLGVGGGAKVSSPLLSGEDQSELYPPLPVGEGRGEGIRATPVARRVAKELGIDLSRVKGTGPEGRIKEEDVKAYAEANARSTQPSVEPMPSSSLLQTTAIELTSIQRQTGQRMLESVQTAPQFSLTLCADMTQALRLRDTFSGQPQVNRFLRPSITAILVKVAAEALKRHPRVNSTFKSGHIEAYQQINIGVALASGGELLAPVIRNADQKSLEQVARQIEALQEKSQSMRFTLEDLSCGTFTISNLGMYGIERFNAILIPGQSAILAVGKIVQTPVGIENPNSWEDGTIALHPLINLTLTVDHRVLDGVQGAQFLNEVKYLIENPSFTV